MRSSLEDVPDEIVRHVLLYLSPEDTLESFQLVSRRYHHLANEALLWRFHCQSSFRWWNPEHKLQEKLAALASSVDWRGLWITRKKTNTKAARLLDGVISTKLGQLRRLKGICELGYDVKDYLLEQCHVDESTEDVLARRYGLSSSLVWFMLLDIIHSRQPFLGIFVFLIGYLALTAFQVLRKLGVGQHTQGRGDRAVVPVPGAGIEL
jgi:F-box protein 21